MARKRPTPHETAIRTTLTFRVADVRRVVEHARRAATHEPFYGKRLGPRVTLVKDEGIYLMSMGLPRDSFVAYALGVDPEGQDPVALWLKCEQAVGSNDFSAPIPLDGFERALADPNVTRLTLDGFETGFADPP